MDLNETIKRVLVEKTVADDKLDKCHCGEIIKTFREKITNALNASPPLNKIVRISFPLPCGPYVKDLLEKENVPLVVVEHTSLSETSEVLMKFDTQHNRVFTVLF